MTPAGRVLCWVVITTSTVCFIVITAIRPTLWFTDNEAFRSFRHGTTIHGLQGPPEPPSVATHSTSLWDGSQGFVVALQWGAVMLAGMATAALKLVKAQHPSIFDGAPCHQLGRHTTLQLVRRVAYTQLPPVALWHHICGGMTLLDASLVLTWVGLTILYMYECTEQHFMEVADTTSLSSADWALARINGAAEASGTVLLFLMMIMFFPVSRSSFLKAVLGQSTQALIKYHRWLAWGTIWIAFGHSCLFFVLWGAQGTLADNINFGSQAAVKNVMGLISMNLFLVIAGTANSWFRSHYHKIFYAIHITSFIVVVAFGIFHSPMMAYWLLPALVLYAMDRAFRYWQLAANWTRLTPADIAVDGSIITLCLRWNRASYAVTPGQTVYLRVPALSLFYTHPFSVADVIDEGNVTRVLLHIRMVGTWTKGLKERLTKGETLRCQVQGPYESKLDYMSAAPAIVLVAGGTGFTPVLALLRRFARMADRGMHVPQVHFLWASRSLCELRLLGSDLLAAATQMTKLQSTKVLESSCSQVSSDSDGQWLHLTLHYTGFEQEQEQTGVTAHLARPMNTQEQEQTAVTVHPASPAKTLEHKQPALGPEAAVTVQLAYSATIQKEAGSHLRPESSSACKSAASGYTPLLQAHPGSSPYIHAISILLTFICAWGGFLLGNLFIQNNMIADGDGYDYMLCAFVQFISILVGAMLPPFVLQATLHLIRLGAFKVASDISQPQQGDSACIVRESVQVLPGYVLAARNTLVDLNAVHLKRGRPNLAALLGGVRQRYAHLQQVDVVVAGPDGLCQAVQDLCQQHKPGEPELVFRRAAYHT